MAFQKVEKIANFAIAKLECQIALFDAKINQICKIGSGGYSDFGWEGRKKGDFNTEIK
jgi:hypothetical protein